jgi:hypothetical protein
LTTRKSAAIGAGLMTQHHVALAALGHCLALKAFYDWSRYDTCIELSPGNGRVGC